MLNKIYIIDFEDSFTFNIASELYIYETRLEVIPHNSFFSEESFNNFMNKSDFPIAVILGPGPGDPREYKNYFDKIKQLKKAQFIYLMGICLGHQMISLIDGFVIRPSNFPGHGIQIKIHLFDQDLLVQRYNSLAVFKSHSNSNEILIRKWKRGISYQFHPESIGTEKRALFFRELLDFIY